MRHLSESGANDSPRIHRGGCGAPLSGNSRYRNKPEDATMLAVVILADRAAPSRTTVVRLRRPQLDDGKQYLRDDESVYKAFLDAAF